MQIFAIENSSDWLKLTTILEAKICCLLLQKCDASELVNSKAHVDRKLMKKILRSCLRVDSKVYPELDPGGTREDYTNVNLPGAQMFVDRCMPAS